MLRFVSVISIGFPTRGFPTLFDEKSTKTHQRLASVSLSAFVFSWQLLAN
jgi:hypothetical protein